MQRRLVVVGAGPVGLAAALLAVERGLAVTVLEQDRPGSSLAAWGPVRMFTPLAMNFLPEARRALSRLPPDDALLTGPEMAAEVLEPLAASPALRDAVRLGVRVRAVGRAGLLRGDHAGHPLRAERPFRLLLQWGTVPLGASTKGTVPEEVVEADAVIDASGTWGRPNPLGVGGLPARGEAALAGEILRDLGAVHAARPCLGGRRVLVVGHGHSAATAIPWLDGAASVTWTVRTPNRRPVVEVARDPLPERARVAAAANALAQDPPPWLRVERRAQVEALERDAGGILVSLTGGRTVEVDAVVGLTGTRPDLAPLSELALALSPATEGTGRLAAALAGVTDCLSIPAVASDDLATGEPGFYLAGAKSYGRASTFLLQTGLAHVRAMVEGIAAR